MKEYVLPPLSQPVFYILLTLNHGPRHGYDLMQQIQFNTQGTVNLSPSTMYSALKRMKTDHLIESATSGRRKYYKITATGRQLLGYELHRFAQALKLASRLKKH